MRVLLVEDNRTLASATARSLTAAGFAVDVANDAEDAWHVWRSTPCEAVVLDIMLGDENGLDLLARARRRGDHDQDERIDLESYRG